MHTHSALQPVASTLTTIGVARRTRYTALMQITTRRRAVAFFIVLGSTLVVIAIGLNITWILRWREVVPLVIGIVLFGLIIAGLIINTIFVVREIRRNEQHDSFINAVTHELKTPIASIRLYLETLQSRDVSAAQRAEFYRVMHKDTDRLMTTVEQVLRAAETVQQRGERNWSPVDIAALLHECVLTARQRHQLNETSLRDASASLPAAATTIMGDAEELRTAIANVLDNAVKYSPAPINISTESLVQHDKVLVRITDQGVGIPHADLNHIFKRFFRTGSSRNKVKGTGLGLFIVRSIVKKHRGKVSADSQGEGKGATITLALPRHVTQ